MVESIFLGMSKEVSDVVLQLSNADRSTIERKVSICLEEFLSHGSSIPILCATLAVLHGDNVVAAHQQSDAHLAIYLDLVSPYVQAKFFYTTNPLQRH